MLRTCVVVVGFDEIHGIGHGALSSGVGLASAGESPFVLEQCLGEKGWLEESVG
jgi:hypothetical protein